MSSEARLPAGWKRVKLGDVCLINRGEAITRKETQPGNVPVIAGGRGVAYYHNEANVKPPVVTVSGSGAYAGYVNFFDTPIYASDCSVILPGDDSISMLYVYYFLKNKQTNIYELKQGSAQPHVYARDLKTMGFFMPPLPEQERIVANLDRQMASLDLARQAAESQLSEINLLPAALLRDVFTRGFEGGGGALEMD